MPPESRKLDEDTLAKLESSNWQERKEVLEVISNQLKCSTLSDAICGLVTKALCQVITSDKHSMLVIRAAGVLSELAQSMNNGFTVHSERALTTCLLKFKDTKANLSLALRSATTAIVDTMSFDLALVHLQTALSTPVAKTQTEALRLLAHIFCKSNLRRELQLSQRLKISKPLLSNVAKFSQHKAPECRDACFQVFAANRIFLDFTSEQFNAIIDNMLDESRRLRVDAAFLQLNEGLLQNNIPHANSDPANLITKSKSKDSRVQQQLSDDFDFPVTPIRASPGISNKPVKIGKQSLHEVFKNPMQGHVSSSTPFSTNQKSTLHNFKQNIQVSALKSSVSKIPSSIQRDGLKQPPGKGKVKAGNKNVIKPRIENCQPQDLNLSPDHLRNRLSETYFVNVPLGQLNDASWKIRLQIAERINAIINSNPPEYPDIHYLLQYILHCGTVKDNNFRVRCEILNILSKLLSQNKSQNWITTTLIISLCDQLFATIGDSKSGPLVEQTLRDLMNVIGFTKTVECIIAGLKKNVSPTIHSSLIKWLSSSIRSLDSSFDHLPLIEIVKFGLGSSSPIVRSSAIGLAGALHACLHSTVNIRPFFSSEKTTILQRLEAEFANIDEKYSVPLSDTKNNNSTFSGLLQTLTPAAIDAWSIRERRMTALIGSISPSQRLTNAEGVLEFSDSDESPVAERSSVPYKRNQPDGLRRPSREMQACSLTLEQMNYVSDLNSSRTIETMVLKLPTHIQQEWLNVAYMIIRGGRKPLFTDLVEFVKEQADIANTRYGLLVTGDPSNRNQRQSVVDTKRYFDSGYKARVSFASTSESDVTPYVRPRTLGLSCLLCTVNHPLDQCERFRDKNVHERIEFASKKKLCNVCPKANHIARNCRAPRSCAVEGCGWRHHTLLHRQREEQGDNNNNNAHINIQLCMEEVVECIQRPVAFAVVPVWIKNGEKIIQTCAFLDSGSDTSLIVDDLADKLSLEGKPITVSLKTLSNESSLLSKEVDVELYSIDFSSSVKVQKVLTVKKLPAVYRTVPTAQQIISWSHLKDISFPRVEDENVKLLIGCNALGVREMKEIRTGKTNEPSAVRTILGWELFSPYGEPHESNHVLNCLSVNEKLEDKFEQLHSTEFKDPLSRTSSMSVEDRIALSKSAYGVAEYNRSENVFRQVHCSLLLTKYKVVKPKTEAPSANKPTSTKGASGS
ncbi:unnamed protein product [Schistosoma curassoni]|uniref:CLASP_N domain-containing protein n=1 Tax=Schistosoma curassoni TaxID=6186 RepID=A0A183K8E5_9TREM|nr:unnamed protein product [Schistosoma curassoni]